MKGEGGRIFDEKAIYGAHDMTKAINPGGFEHVQAVEDGGNKAGNMA